MKFTSVIPDNHVLFYYPDVMARDLYVKMRGDRLTSSSELHEFWDITFEVNRIYHVSDENDIEWWYV